MGGDQDSKLHSPLLLWNSQTKSVPSFYQLFPATAVCTTILFQFHQPHISPLHFIASSSMELTDFIPHFLGSPLHHFANFIWHNSGSNTPMGPGMQHKNRAYLFQLHQESDVVSLLSCQFAIRCEYAKALGGFAGTLLGFCCVPFPHTIRAVIRNNFPVSAKWKRSLCNMQTGRTTVLTGKRRFLRFL